MKSSLGSASPRLAGEGRDGGPVTVSRQRRTVPDHRSSIARPAPPMSLTGTVSSGLLRVARAAGRGSPERPLPAPSAKAGTRAQSTRETRETPAIANAPVPTVTEAVTLVEQPVERGAWAGDLSPRVEQRAARVLHLEDAAPDPEPAAKTLPEVRRGREGVGVAGGLQDPRDGPALFADLGDHAVDHRRGAAPGIVHGEGCGMGRFVDEAVHGGARGRGRETGLDLPVRLRQGGIGCVKIVRHRQRLRRPARR